MDQPIECPRVHDCAHPQKITLDRHGCCNACGTQVSERGRMYHSSNLSGIARARREYYAYEPC